MRGRLDYCRRMPQRLVAIAAAALAAVLVLVGADVASARSVALPPTDGSADYQLGGSYAPATGVTVVTRDSSSKPAPGVYSICYINGFQTQPERRAFWLRHPGLVLTKNGKKIIDPNWPDELMLDTSTAAKRAKIARIIGRTIDACARKGFDAIEIDNLDSFTRSQELLTASDNRRLATAFAKRAHARGLAIGQKNAAEYARSFKKSVGFDFAVSEECYRFDECGRYTGVYRHVIDIEYTDDLRGSFADACTAPNRPSLTVLRDRDLVRRGTTGYVYRSC